MHPLSAGPRMVGVVRSVTLHLNAPGRTDVLAQVAMDAAGQKLGFRQLPRRPKRVFRLLVDARVRGTPFRTPCRNREYTAVANPPTAVALTARPRNFTACRRCINMVVFDNPRALIGRPCVSRFDANRVRVANAHVLAQPATHARFGVDDGPRHRPSSAAPTGQDFRQVPQVKSL